MIEIYRDGHLLHRVTGSTDPDDGTAWLREQGAAVMGVTPVPTHAVPGGQENYPNNGLGACYRVETGDRMDHLIVIRL